MSKHRSIHLLAALALLMPAAFGVTAAAPAEESTQDEINARILGYHAAYPDDLAGLDALTMKYVHKHVLVGVSGIDRTLTGAEAQAHVTTAQSLRPSSDRAMAAIPTDAFVVRIQAIPLYGPPDMYRFTGDFNFRNNWAGQKSPDDIASIQFSMPDCMRMIGHGMTTYDIYNKSTGLGFLKSANIGNKAPIWGIRDYTKGFVNQADHGYPGVTVQDYCGGTHQVAAAFDYEANAGGSILGVSAGWGFVSVSYSGPSMHIQKGTAPVYVNF